MINEKEKVISMTVMPIYHYDFVNKDGRQVKTTKFVGKVGKHDEYAIDGTSNKLIDKELYVNVVCRGYYDGKKWIIIGF